MVLLESDRVTVPAEIDLLLRGDRWFDFAEASRRLGDYRLALAEMLDHADLNGNSNQFEYVPKLNLEQFERVHRVAYGDTPRRISCETALVKTAFTPVLFCHIANAPKPASDTPHLDGGILYHIYEPEETLYLGARQVAEHTWISSPARALLDCGHYHCTNRVQEWIITAVRLANFRVDEMIELSEQIGMQDATRRICSIASLLPEKDREDRQWLHHLAEYASQFASEQIWVDTKMPQSNIYWEDKNFGVLWNVPPEPVIDYCYP